VSDNLLANEISDLNLMSSSLAVLLNVDVDWEMGVDVSHLVLVSLGDTDNHVGDERFDGSKSGDGLSFTVVKGNVDDWLAWSLGEGDTDVLEVLLEFTSWTDDGDDTGFDSDGDY